MFVSKVETKSNLSSKLPADFHISLSRSIAVTVWKSFQKTIFSDMIFLAETPAIRRSKNSFYVWSSLIVVLVCLRNYLLWSFRQSMSRQFLTCKKSFKNIVFDARCFMGTYLVGFSLEMPIVMVFRDLQTETRILSIPAYLYKSSW